MAAYFKYYLSSAHALLNAGDIVIVAVKLGGANFS